MYSGRTLLSFAAASGNNHMIRLLLNNGAEVNNRNKNGVPAIV
jgi:ankyrin repeat protein